MNIERLILGWSPLDDHEEQVKRQFFYWYQGAGPHYWSRGLKSGHMTGSALITNYSKTRVFLLFHKKLQKWLQPGGHMDEGEHPYEAALREAFEETGLQSIRPVSDALLSLDIHPIPEKGGEPPHFHYDLSFWFEADDHELIQMSNESEKARWFDVSEALAFNERALSRMIRHALH